MRPPQAPGVAIDSARKRRWYDRFRHFRYPPSQSDIDDWIGQFDEAHADLAARLLDSVEVVPRFQMDQAFRTLMAALPGWHRFKSRRQGRWRFVPYSTSAGESGDVMIAYLRQALGMRQKHFSELFIQPQNLPSERLTQDDTVVLVDDFAGSGDQACTSWDDLFKELVGDVGNVFLLVVAASKKAQDEIGERTDLQLMAHLNLLDSDNIFSDRCHHFSAADKTDILGYCQRHFPSSPKGYGDCGLIFVLHHDCPNNTIPILHSQNKNRWRPLFPRVSPP
jgi:hypothetical protein